MNIRDQEQEKAFQAWKATEQGIINACPRFGKIRVGIKAIQWIDQIAVPPVLIAAPRKDIFLGWKKDFKLLGVDESGIEFVTFNSLKHKVKNSYSLVIIDEIHEASEAQRKEINKFTDVYCRVMGLSGTMTKKTEEELMRDCGLEVVYKYSIEQGVKSGILCDYEITIHQVPLDNTHPIYNSRYGKVSEAKKFGAYKALCEKAPPSGKKFWTLQMTHLIQNSLAKSSFTRKLLKQYENQRVLVFTGLTAIANDLDIPVYHSKAKDKKVFTEFCDGKGKHLATIKMMQAGITIKPIHMGIINYTSGNPEDGAQKICRFLGIEYDNIQKKAYIHIVCSTEPFEKERIKTALMFFDAHKIVWI